MNFAIRLPPKVSFTPIFLPHRHSIEVSDNCFWTMGFLLQRRANPVVSTVWLSLVQFLHPMSPGNISRSLMLGTRLVLLAQGIEKNSPTNFQSHTPVRSDFENFCASFFDQGYPFPSIKLVFTFTIFKLIFVHRHFVVTDRHQAVASGRDGRRALLRCFQGRHRMRHAGSRPLQQARQSRSKICADGEQEFTTLTSLLVRGRLQRSVSGKDLN